MNIQPKTIVYAVLTMIIFAAETKQILAAPDSLAPVQACIAAYPVKLTTAQRTNIAHCLGWQSTDRNICQGFYSPLAVPSFPADKVEILADKVIFSSQSHSQLSGNIEVLQTNRLLNAETAYIQRDGISKKITAIELINGVKYIEPDKLILAKKVWLNPANQAATIEDVLYRFDTKRRDAVLPAWGRAKVIKRLANKDLILQNATYSTCAPTKKGWQIEAKKIKLNAAKATAVFEHAKFKLGQIPVFYSPYLSFSTSRNQKYRKSGFLMPVKGYSNVGGFELALPYYWNIAPNYDATLTPQYYTRRGLMVSGEFRYLTSNSSGIFYSQFIPSDQAYKKFVLNNLLYNPQSENTSADRWSIDYKNDTHFSPNLQLKLNYQHVSDDYYLQDFSTNLALLTQRQLMQEGSLTYQTKNWQWQGLLQSYQTLQPINEAPIVNVYRRLPQIAGRGFYDDLPGAANLAMTVQYDNFFWPKKQLMPEGPRFYLNPVLSVMNLKPWGFLTPAVEVVQNYYAVRHNVQPWASQFTQTTPRYSLDSGLYFERLINSNKRSFIQTLEPRIYLLKVPYHNQTAIPVYDAAYMIFNVDQLFRNNRFSGYDRIGDTAQISYALTSKWLVNASGIEKASFTIGQIHYFSARKVQLCQADANQCADNTATLGYLSPTSTYSPIAARANFNFNPLWGMSADYVWDTTTHSANNRHIDLHYQRAPNKLLNMGYTYLVNGDITQAYNNQQNSALHQAIFSYAWPFSEKWSSIGAFNYNISKKYQMMSLLGMQYDNCCWALRLMGGRIFQNLDNQYKPNYNNNVYLQIQLKGLGALGNNDPTNIINTYVPGYVDKFHH